MHHGLSALRAVFYASCCLLPVGVHAGEFDSEHIFGFMIGTDIGGRGEREFQSQSTGSFGRSGGRHSAGQQEFELEFVPAENLRIENGSGFADRGWQGASIDIRYRFADRETAPFGATLAVEAEASRINETSNAAASSLGLGFVLAFDREIVRDVAIAALNLSYRPEWSQAGMFGATERESTMGVSVGLLAKLRPDVLLGGEARYLRQYEGLGLGDLAGQALYVGPTAYLQLSDRARLTASWSSQVWGRAGGGSGTLDVINFDRHQARLVYGVNF